MSSKQIPPSCSVFMIVHVVMCESPFLGQSKCQMWPRGCQMSLLSSLNWIKLVYFPILIVPCPLSSSLSIPLQLSLAPVVHRPLATLTHSVSAQHLQHSNFMQCATCFCMMYVCSRPLSVLLRLSCPVPWCPVFKTLWKYNHLTSSPFLSAPSSPPCSLFKHIAVCCRFWFSFTMRISKSIVPLVAHPRGGGKLWHSKQNHISSVFLQCQKAAGPKYVLCCAKKAADPIICMPHHTYDTRTKANLHTHKEVLNFIPFSSKSKSIHFILLLRYCLSSNKFILEFKSGD